MKPVKYRDEHRWDCDGSCDPTEIERPISEFPGPPQPMGKISFPIEFPKAFADLKFDGSDILEFDQSGPDSGTIIWLYRAACRKIRQYEPKERV
jgi:hypothetical protein